MSITFDNKIACICYNYDNNWLNTSTGKIIFMPAHQCFQARSQSIEGMLKNVSQFGPSTCISG